MVSFKNGYLVNRSRSTTSKVHQKCQPDTFSGEKYANHFSLHFLGKLPFRNTVGRWIFLDQVYCDIGLSNLVLAVLIRAKWKALWFKKVSWKSIECHCMPVYKNNIWNAYSFIKMNLLKFFQNKVSTYYIEANKSQSSWYAFRDILDDLFC